MREYLLVFLVAMTVTYLLTVFAREFALRTGAVAAVRDRDVHAEPIPYLGGVAMLGGLVAAYLVARERTKRLWHRGRAELAPMQRQMRVRLQTWGVLAGARA